MNAKKLLALLLAICLVLTFAVGCGGSEGESGEPAAEGGDAVNADATKIMVAFWFAEDHPVYATLQKFEEEAEELSNGSLDIEIYPNSQLGSEDTYIDSVKQGTVQMGATGTMIAKYHPAIYCQETPFLFKDWDEANAVLNGDLASYITDGFDEASGMHLMGTMVNGFREFSSNKTMNSMEEFKGQRIRVPNVPNYVAMVECLGASPIAMSLTDLFTALEQGSVDGQDNPYPTDYAQSFQEVQKYILESRHMFSPVNMVINSDFYYNTLTDEQREAIDKAMADAIAYNWEISEEADGVAKQQLIDAGVEITVPDEAYVKQLQDAMQGAYDWYFSDVEGAEEFIKAVWEWQGK